MSHESPPKSPWDENRGSRAYVPTHHVWNTPTSKRKSFWICSHINHLIKYMGEKQTKVAFADTWVETEESMVFIQTRFNLLSFCCRGLITHSFHVTPGRASLSVTVSLLRSKHCHSMCITQSHGFHECFTMACVSACEWNPAVSPAVLWHKQSACEGERGLLCRHVTLPTVHLLHMSIKHSSTISITTTTANPATWHRGSKDSTDHQQVTMSSLHTAA